MKRQPLPDFWWVNRSHTRYVCPFLMTLSCWLYRLRGKNARWYGGSREGEERGPSAIVLIGNGEARCLFPRAWIIAECNFRNWRALQAWRLRKVLGR